MANVPTIVVEVRNMPEVIWKLRREMANVLREEAKSERGRIATRLREIAARFEVGQ